MLLSFVARVSVALAHIVWLETAHTPGVQAEKLTESALVNPILSLAALLGIAQSSPIVLSLDRFGAAAAGIGGPLGLCEITRVALQRQSNCIRSRDSSHHG